MQMLCDGRIPCCVPLLTTWLIFKISIFQYKSAFYNWSPSRQDIIDTEGFVVESSWKMLNSSLNFGSRYGLLYWSEQHLSRSACGLFGVLLLELERLGLGFGTLWATAADLCVFQVSESDSGMNRFISWLYQRQVKSVNGINSFKFQIWAHVRKKKE